jgi:hypothetical protein
VNVGFPKSFADPFLVAQALAERDHAGLWAGEVVVVSSERSHAPRMSVRDACLGEGLRCLNLEEWFAEENWRIMITPQKAGWA